MVPDPIQSQEWVLFPFLFVRPNIYSILGYKYHEGIMPVSTETLTTYKVVFMFVVLVK